MSQILVTLTLDPEVFAAIEQCARSLAQALNELVPPILTLLADVRADLGFTVKELLFLAAAFIDILPSLKAWGGCQSDVWTRSIFSFPIRVGYVLQ